MYESIVYFDNQRNDIMETIFGRSNHCHESAFG